MLYRLSSRKWIAKHVRTFSYHTIGKFDPWNTLHLEFGQDGGQMGESRNAGRETAHDEEICQRGQSKVQTLR